jgi:hypothetical protein
VPQRTGEAADVIVASASEHGGVPADLQAGATEV